MRQDSNFSYQNTAVLSAQKTEKLLKEACAKIAPLWSLENFVAVNPYLGLTSHSFNEAMGVLAQTGGVKATLPVQFYLDALSKGQLTKEDIQHVLEECHHALAHDIDAFIQQLADEPIETNLPSIAGTASAVTENDWGKLMIDRLSNWASVYFDNQQAIWKTTKEQGIYQSWRSEACIDRTPEIMGIPSFRSLAKQLPKDAIEAASYALAALQISEQMLPMYLHHLLLRLGGWAGFIARIDWDKGLQGIQSHELTELLAVLLSWEVILLQAFENTQLPQQWIQEKSAWKLPKQAHAPATLLMQEAFDYAHQRSLIAQLRLNKPAPKAISTPKAQAVFCIDVRSEVFRRHLEVAMPSVETLGFAGFFAFPIKYVPLGHEQGTAQCPVLLNTSHTIEETMPEAVQQQVVEKRQHAQHVSKAWKSFKLGAITCFSFVGPVGLAYLPKLFTDSFGLTRPVPHPEHKEIAKEDLHKKHLRIHSMVKEDITTGIPFEEQVKMAGNALRAMSLTENFARLVMIVGHGSSSVNNPHATGLDCGACGGHTGEANAKVASAILNETAVRKALATQGIEIPDSTVFIACQHDTTTDELSIFNENLIPASHQQDLAEIKKALLQAGKGARMERGLRMGLDANANMDALIMERSKDWSQVRPEWGLAGCSALIVANRQHTKDLDLKGRSFLHSYDWKKDQGFGILELIMTAPMVVASWINLQYYASTVDNRAFGSGNKVLHNVVGGLGVLEGHSGDLRSGLPWQSVHDGTNYQHEPLRLKVVIEAPINEMSKILAKHESIRNLCDNGWIYLFSMNEKGNITYQYTSDLQWMVVD